MIKTKTYRYAESIPTRDDVAVYVNGEKQKIFCSDNTDILAFSFSERADVEIIYSHEIKRTALRPYSKNQTCVVEGNKVTFSLSEPMSLLLDTEGERQLHIHANSISEAAEECTYHFREGEVYDVGEIVLKNGDTMYVEGGAVVRGSIYAKNADNIHIFGNGIFDGSFFKGASKRLCIFENCTSLTVEDIILVNPQLWMLTVVECSNVKISRLKEAGAVISSDGIDIVSSHDVTVKDCFLRNNDDCIVIKAMSFNKSNENVSDVYNVRVSGCTILNDQCGNAIEIGHELRAERIYDIHFEDMDIISVHGTGAAFSIHNADDALVEDIKYKNIRIEHYYDKLVDLRIIKSMWGKTEKRGFVRNISFKNIYVTNSIYNPGYSISVIGGYDIDHKISGVHFRDFYINDTKIMRPDMLPLYTADAEDITFE